MYSEVDVKKLGKKLLSHRPHHSVSSRTKQGCYVSTNIYCIVSNTFLETLFFARIAMVPVSALSILCLVYDCKVIVYVSLIKTYLPNRICVPLIPKTFFITSLSSFVDLYPLEIKNCKYKYIFNIIISSTKILKLRDF